MILTQQIKQAPRWHVLIKQQRKRLKETKVDFGKRFGVTGQAVFYWESNINEPPSSVTWYLYQQELRRWRK
jgi:DNA-binding transcriptional regulator YiaG